jgi:hypothetical protein
MTSIQATLMIAVAHASAGTSPSADSTPANFLTKSFIAIFVTSLCLFVCKSLVRFNPSIENRKQADFYLPDFLLVSILTQQVYK